MAVQSHPSHALVPLPGHCNETHSSGCSGAGPGTNALLHFGYFPPHPTSRVTPKAGLSLQGGRAAKKHHTPIPGGVFSTKANGNRKDSRPVWGPEAGNFLLMGHDLLWNPKCCRWRETGERGEMKCWSRVCSLPCICPWLQQREKGWLRFIK